jgi:hypothetical protein
VNENLGRGKSELNPDKGKIFVMVNQDGGELRSERILARRI